MNSKFVFKFSPDVQLEDKLDLNIDITVAMPCSSKPQKFDRYKFAICSPLELGTDVLDSTNQNTYKFGTLNQDDTWFELSDNQKVHFEHKKHFNSYLREEYHAIKVQF